MTEWLSGWRWDCVVEDAHTAPDQEAQSKTGTWGGGSTSKDLFPVACHFIHTPWPKGSMDNITAPQDGH